MSDPITPASSHTSVRPRSSRRPSSALALGGAAVALILQVIFIASYLGALHDPRPRQALPMAIVAPAQLATGLVERITAQAGDVLAPRVAADEAALHRAMDEREVYGGLVIGQQGATLIVADAASLWAAAVLERFAQGFAAGQNLPLTVEHVHPLESGDPRGLTSIYLVVGWVFGGYFCATVLISLGGTGYQSRSHAAMRLLLLAGYAVVSGVVGAMIAGPVISALTGHFWPVALAGMLLVFAVAAATMALQLLLGIAGTLVVLVVFVLLGTPASGGIVPPEFLPGFWRALGPWLPNAAGFELTRNLVYFEGQAISRPLVVVAVYAAAGSVLLLLFATHRRPATPIGGDPEAELAAAAGAA